MGYIGNEPTTGHFPVDNFTSSGGSTYTLAKAPASAGAIEVSVQGVLQPTTAYSISGTTLTMAGVTTGVKIFVRHLGETLVLPTPADGSVTTSKLGINSVDGTKIAMGSDAAGDILYHGATDYARLAKGTAGQALVMNSGATAPEWGSGLPTAGVDGQVLTSDGTNWASEAAAGGGAWEFVSSVTASTSATLAFTNMADGYDYHYVIEDCLPATNAVDMDIQLGIAGPTYRTTGYKASGTAIQYDNSSYSIEVTDGFIIMGTGVFGSLGNQTNEGVRRCEFSLTNPAGSGTFTNMVGSGLISDSSTVAMQNHICGWYNTTAEAHTSIKFFMSSGNIVSGAIYQYRRARS